MSKHNFGKLTGGVIAGATAIVLALGLAVFFAISALVGGGAAMSQQMAAPLGALASEQIDMDSAAKCSLTSGSGSYSVMTGQKADYVKTAMAVANKNNIGDNGKKAALMTMAQESMFKNHANSGKNQLGFSDWPAPGGDYWLSMAKKSMNMPHDAVGNDADSVGLYQQRASAGWADSTDGFKASQDGEKAIQRLMNPEYSSMAYFGVGETSSRGMTDIPGWQSMAPDVLSQAIQGSAYPDAYTKWGAEADQLLKMYGDNTTISGGSGSSDDKKDDSKDDSSSDESDSSAPTKATSEKASSSGFLIPMKSGSFQMGSPFGMRDIGLVNGVDVSNHTGQDMVADMGTPIYAAADGVVVGDGYPTGNPADGTWLVIDHEIKGQKYSTLYAHMELRDFKVRKGDTVKAGQQIGAVGMSGWTTGPHLHFEIWDGGRLTGGNPVDPKKLFDGSYVSGSGAVRASNGGGSCATTAGNTSGKKEDGGVAVSGTVGDVIEAGKKQVGIPYSWGGGTKDGPSEGFGPGAGVKGFDCSSLMMYMVYQGTGETLPRVAADQYKYTQGNKVASAGDKNTDKLKPGDLLFYGSSPDTIHHVGMYIGGGKMLHAPVPGQDIEIVDVFYNDYFGATRMDFKSK